jgi:hypothetical protein
LVSIVQAAEVNIVLTQDFLQRIGLFERHLHYRDVIAAHGQFNGELLQSFV